MKKILLILGLLLALTPARAADQQLYIIVTVTNAFGTTNIVNSITVNGSLRKHTNNVSSSPSTLIQSTNIQTVAATNMFRHFANYPPPGNGVTVTPYSTNAFQINALANDTLTYALAGDWGTITLKTNPVTGGTSLRVPMTTYNPTNQTNYASMLAAGLNLSTTALAQASTVLSNAVQLTLAQTVANKTITNSAIEGGTVGFASEVPVINLLIDGGTFSPSIRFKGSGGFTTAYLKSVDSGPVLYNNSGGSTPLDVTFPDDLGVLLNYWSGIRIFPSLGGLWIGTNEWNLKNWWHGTNNIFFDALKGTNVMFINGTMTNVAGAFSGATITNLTALGGVSSNMFSTRVTISNAVSINGTLGTVTNGIAISLLTQNLAATNSTFQGTNIWQGDVSYPWFNLTSLNSGNNQAVPLGTNRQVMLGGNSAAATIIGFTGQRDGKPVKLYNNSSSPITLAQNTSDPVPENRIIGNVSGDVSFQPKEIFEVNWVPSDSRWHFTVPTATATNIPSTYGLELFTMTADGSVTNITTSTNTIWGSGTGSLTLSNGFWAVGKSVQAEIEGNYWDGATPGLSRFVAMLNTSTATNTIGVSAFTPPISISGDYFKVALTITCRTNSTIGALSTTGTILTLAAGTPTQRSFTNQITILDTTTNLVFDIGITNGAPTDSWQAHNGLFKQR